MSDAADILGIKQSAPTSSAQVAVQLMADTAKPKPSSSKHMKKPKGMSREVFDLIGRDKDSLVPAMQSNAAVAAGAFKSKRVSALKGKWIWAPFTSSARPKDEVNKTFYHWVKADVQYIDYPYAKFNVKMDVVHYTDEEYEHLLKSDKWTRAETDHLMYVCYKYELRWPVVVDRYSMLPSRRTEEIQERYLSVVSKIRAHRTGSHEGAPMAKNEASTTFDVAAERARREQLDCLFRKSKQDEAEEVKLREELKLLDVLLKTKKGGRGGAGASTALAAAGGGESRVLGKGATAETKQVAAAAVANAMAYSSSPFTLPLPPDHSPAPGKPCLQSTRLVGGDEQSGLSRVLLKKMQSLLKELGAPEAPLPTRAVCDAYDTVKKDAVTLLSLHNAIQRKEKELAALKALNPSSQTATSKCFASGLLIRGVPFPVPILTPESLSCLRRFTRRNHSSRAAAQQDGPSRPQQSVHIHRPAGARTSVVVRVIVVLRRRQCSCWVRAGSPQGRRRVQACRSRSCAGRSSEKADCVQAEEGDGKSGRRRCHHRGGRGVQRRGHCRRRGRGGKQSEEAPRCMIVTNTNIRYSSTSSSTITSLYFLLLRVVTTYRI